MQTHDAARQRARRRWLLMAWPASLLLAGAIAFWFGQSPVQIPLPRGNRALVRQLQAENEQLKQQVADLKRSQQVADVAMRSLQRSMAEREEQISGLRADLGFYSRLVGGDGQRQGLRIQEVRVQPVAQSNAWNVTLSLTQNMRRGDEIGGKVTITVEGLSDNQVQQLSWDALGDNAQKDGLPFKFRYFQQLHATFVLPAGFRPTRLRIHAAPDQGATADRAVAWNDALNGTITSTRGDSDAQP
ncbi:DUF6776 family protein [Dyella ginsengisoli]|uniref:DUF6776 family protein n=1 Tax=Dyella ginsengisoli TaxID=363848 RepID=UPI0003478F53|nr:DUF6776 family protein [Dyella ginsengisoli]